MLLKELEKMASRNEPIPKNLTPPQTRLYLSLAILYRLYRLKVYTKNQASAEKKKIIDAYEMDMLYWRVYEKAVKNREKLSPMFRDMAEGDCERCQKVVEVITGYGGKKNDKN